VYSKSGPITGIFGFPIIDRRMWMKDRCILISTFVVIVLFGTFATVGVGASTPPEAVSEDGLWQARAESSMEQNQSEPWIQPVRFGSFSLDQIRLNIILSQVGMEFTDEAQSRPVQISLPMPDGTFARFEVVESPVMAPELAARFPEIKTYMGQGIDDASATVRFDRTPAGFHAQILSPNGAVYIDPCFRGDLTLYACYHKRDYRKDAEGFSCIVLPHGSHSSKTMASANLLQSGDTLRTYRLACAATGEYTIFHGGTVSTGLAALTTAINRVTGIYETELAIRMELVANNNLLVYTDPATDPYTNSDGIAMISENQSTVDSVIGIGNYDIGHVFSTGGGGVAYLGVVCVNSLKAGGVTGQSSPIGDPFYIDYVAHEMGHQFGANHTFNGTGGSCGGANRNASTAYEPGSGSTIMAYAGICGGNDDLQSNSDPYFHFASFEEITDYVTGGSGSSCPVTSSTGNQAPTVDAGVNNTIPYDTPFILTVVSSSDPDGDTLTYCWEERDLGPAQPASGPGSEDNGSSPLFRSFLPTLDPLRIFPKLSDIINNSTTIGEQLPTTNRTLNFRVTARDNKMGGGGVNSDDKQVTVTTSAGPFRVTSPNTSVSLSGAVTVTWDVAGTDNSPVNTTQVNILLSTDGGNTYPTTLQANTPNDGTETVSLPSLSTTTARVKVEAVGNIYFDISDSNFTITPSQPVWFVSTGNNTIDDSSGNNNGWIDPNEKGIGLTVEIMNGGTSTATGVSATLTSLTPTVSVVVSGSAYPNLSPGGTGTNSTAFVIDVNGSHVCGDPIDLRLSVNANEGTNNVDFNLTTGSALSPNTLFFDDFESGGGNWAVTSLWHLQANSSCISPPYQSASNAMAFNEEVDCNYDTGGTASGSLAMNFDLAIPSQAESAELTWYDYIETENAFEYDVYSVDVSTNSGGSWTPLFSGYALDTVWNQETVDIVSFIGQSVRVRFLFDSVDSVSNGYDGWYVDDVSITVTERSCEPVLSPSDFDGDGDVDQEDFGHFQVCHTSSGNTQTDPNCLDADVDGDGDVDPDDFTVFNDCLSGANIPADPSCTG
jgi:hypothetical protein